MRLKSKKAQEEIVGFVSIIVIVTIIGIILLGFIIRNGSSETDKDNRDLLRFLESAMTYTSNCTLDYGYTYKTVKELTKLCYQKPDSVCSNTHNVCKVLNNTLIGILKAGWGTVDNSTFVKGYTYTLTYSKNLTNDFEKDVFLTVKEGECTGSNTRGYSIPTSVNPNIESKLNICLSES